MLSKFAVSNYRGFSQRIELDLSNPGKYDFNIGIIKNGIIKNALIYGSNGSGKSNLGLAIFDIVHHLTLKTKQADYGRNFSYAGKTEKPVLFEYTFVFDSEIVVYKYAKNRSTQLVDESFSVNGELWFSRNGGLNLNEKYFSVSSEMQEKWANPANNTSFVSFLLGTFPLDKTNPLVKMQHFVDNMLFFRNLDSRSYIGFEIGSANLEKFIIENNLENDFSQFLKEVSGQKFHFISPSSGDEFLQCLVENTLIPFSYIRSTGTDSLTLLYFWYVRMKSLPFVFIDEFDAFYHFELSFHVCKKLFELPDTQVILTTHNTHLMSNYLLRPDCNFLLEQNILKSLNNCTEKELRFGHNIEKLYRGGTFSV